MTNTVKPVTRETMATEHGRPLVVELRSKTLVIHEKGLRQGYELTYGQIYMLGAANQAAELRNGRARDRRKQFREGLATKSRS